MYMKHILSISLPSFNLPSMILQKVAIMLLLLFSLILCQEIEKTQEHTEINQESEISQEVLINLKNAFDQAYIQVSLLYEFAKKNSIQVSNEEFENHFQAHKILLPEEMINKKYIKESIAIKKYLALVESIALDEFTLQSIYEQVTKQISESLRPPYSQIKPFVYCIALFENERTKDILRERSAEHNKERFEKRNKTPCWSFDELRIKGEPETCIASVESSGECLITVRDFNVAAKVKHNLIRKIGSLDSTRLRLINDMLMELYFSRKAQKNGYTDKQNLDKEIERSIKKGEYFKKFKNLGRPVSDEDALWETYGKYYDEYFSRKEELTIGIIGSSDSLYIDSLHSWMGELVKDDSTRKQKEESCRILKKIPWKESDWNDLPDELVIPTNSLKLNEFTEPIKTPYGYFIARINKIEIRDEIPFEEAPMKKLIYLATRDRYLNTDSTLEVKSYEFYKRHKHKYVTPDTLKVSACLLPCLPDSIKLCDSIINKINGNSKKITFYSTDLPENARKGIEKLYQKNRNAKKLKGPFDTRYGVFFFKVRDSKPGGKQLSFENVLDDIVYKLQNNEGDIDIENDKEDAVLKEAQQEYLKTQVLAGMYMNQELNTKRKSQEEIWNLIQKGEIDISNFKDRPKNEIVLLAMEKYDENVKNHVENNREKWLNAIVINRDMVNIERK